MVTTAELTEAILLAASERGALLVRNNSGVARYKNHVVRYGVGTHRGGGGDLIGLTHDGIFLSIEIKVGKDSQRKLQKQWQNWITCRNGRAGVARSVEDAIRIIEGDGQGKTI
jgi:hypothetical protein